MNSPLDAFPSEKAGSGPTQQVRNAPAGQARTAREAAVRVACSPAMDRTRTALATVYARIVRVGVRIAIAWRTARRRAFVRRERRAIALARPPGNRLAVVTTAALTSVGVSLLTMWTWSQGPTPVPAAALATASITPALPHVRQAALVTSPSVPARGNLSAAVPTANSGLAGAPIADDDSRLVVITTPEGARVTINGVGWGTTPLTVRHLPPGPKRVRVTMAGFRSEERVVGAKPAQAATLRLALRELPSLRAGQ